MKRDRSIAVCALALVLAGVACPCPAQELEVGGEIRPRMEVRGSASGPLGEETLERTSMRTRLSARARVLEDVRVFVQVQDVRVWGGEAGTTDGMAEGLDLHQGWLELGDLGSAGLSARVGRQELSYGGQRLVGSLNWAQQGRSFDGVRLRLRPRPGVVLDGFAMQVGDLDGGQPDESFVGLYGVLDAGGTVDLYVLYDDRDQVVGRSGPGGLRTAELSEKLTVGGRWATTRGAVSWRIEAAYQTGETRSGSPSGAIDDVAAYLLAARVGAEVSNGLDVALWYDYVSGDDNPGDGELRVFDTLFATNHKFYGFMDLFLNLPAHTAGRGLRDLAAKSTYALTNGHTVGVDVHRFGYSATGGLDSGHAGDELDLTYRWSYGPGVVLTGGASYFRVGDAGPVPSAPTVGDGVGWCYVMIDVAF